MFGYFEKRVPPYPAEDPQLPPAGFIAFLWACTRGMRGWIVLLTLTIVSGVLYLTTILTNIVTGQITHRAFEDAPFGAPPESAYWVGAVVGLILLVGMYLAVYIPLRKRLREGWYAGAVFATVGLIHAALSAVVAPGNLLLGLPGIALVVVNGIWLFIAFRPGVREGLG